MQKDLLRAERLAATGETVAGLAHAIKNILGGLKGGRFMVNKGFELNENEISQGRLGHGGTEYRKDIRVNPRPP